MPKQKCMPQLLGVTIAGSLFRQRTILHPSNFATCHAHIGKDPLVSHTELHCTVLLVCTKISMEIINMGQIIFPSQGDINVDRRPLSLPVSLHEGFRPTPYIKINNHLTPKVTPKYITTRINFPVIVAHFDFLLEILNILK